METAQQRILSGTDYSNEESVEFEDEYYEDNDDDIHFKLQEKIHSIFIIINIELLSIYAKECIIIVL